MSELAERRRVHTHERILDRAAEASDALGHPDGAGGDAGLGDDAALSAVLVPKRLSAARETGEVADGRTMERRKKSIKAGEGGGEGSSGVSERSKQSRRAEASSGSRSDGGGRRRTWTLLVVAAGMGDEGRVAVMPPSRVMSLAMGSVIVAGALSAPADGSTALAPPPRSRWWMAAGGSAVVVLGGVVTPLSA